MSERNPWDIDYPEGDVKPVTDEEREEWMNQKPRKPHKHYPASSTKDTEGSYTPSVHPTQSDTLGGKD